MWPHTFNVATVLLLLTGYTSVFTTVLPTSGNTINSNESVLSEFICGHNLENCYGEQRSTYIYVKDDKIYKTEVYDIKLPATLDDIVYEQKKLLTGMGDLEHKMQKQDIEIRFDLETVERNLIEKNSDISTTLKQEEELLKSKLTHDISNQASLQIDKPTDADAHVIYPSSCADAFEKDINAESGIYTLHLPNSTYADPFEVYCLADPEGGAAWTVVQRRTDGSNEFNFFWDDFEAGYGDVKNAFFIGLKKLHALTNDQPSELWIQMEDFEGEKRFAKYSEFAIGGLSENYGLNELNGITGDAGDTMSVHKGEQLSAKYLDDHYYLTKSCAITYMGAGWYKNCRRSFDNIKGLYLVGELFRGGISWNTESGYIHSLKYVHMAVRPKGRLS